MYRIVRWLLASLALVMLTVPLVSLAAADSSIINVVATTTMLADLTRTIGGDKVDVHGLMGPGIDPHLYQASAGDVIRMHRAEVVVYNGIHLEGKMAHIFANLGRLGVHVISVEKSIPEEQLLLTEDGVYDPHVWFDVSLWKKVAQAVAAGLTEVRPEYGPYFQTNLNSYLQELDAADSYIRSRVEKLPVEKRVLVTAHDAFSYFGEAYGFEVHGLQGISTDAEAGTGDISALADFIVEREIRAIFVESSVPPRTVEALQAAVRARGFDTAIGGELYSDSLGGEGSGAETYILTVRANIDTIVDALK